VINVVITFVFSWTWRRLLCCCPCAILRHSAMSAGWDLHRRATSVFNRPVPYPPDLCANPYRFVHSSFVIVPYLTQIMFKALDSYSSYFFSVRYASMYVNMFADPILCGGRICPLGTTCQVLPYCIRGYCRPQWFCLPVIAGLFLS
jgi:hypothetical protein